MYWNLCALCGCLLLYQFCKCMDEIEICETFWSYQFQIFCSFLSSLHIFLSLSYPKSQSLLSQKNPNETVRKTQIEKNLRESEKEREIQVQRFSRNIPPNKMVRFFPLSNMILVTLFTFSFSFFGFVTYFDGRN